MPSLSAFERRTAILEYLQQHERASTRQLSEHFNVSAVTIRTDLASLASDGRLTRKRGGAALVRSPLPEATFDVRLHQAEVEKAEIARQAAAMIMPGETILLDASTTAYRLALELRERAHLTVITNNLQAALLLACNSAMEVILIGGQLRGSTWSAVGPLAEEMVAKLHASRAFFGVAGLSLERGLTDADAREVQMKRAMIAAASAVTVLADASKFGRNALLSFAALQEVDHVITDAGITDHYRDILRRFEIELTTV